MPERIQRKRTKGWKMPKNTVYVGRPSRWGNPFAVCEQFQNLALWIAMYGVMPPDQLQFWRVNDGVLIETAQYATNLFRDYAKWRMGAADGQAWLEPLRGKDLACWCPLGQPCHAEVLLELANQP